MHLYHQIVVNQGQNLTSLYLLMPNFSSNFQKTCSHWKLKKNETIIGNKEVNYPDILPQEQPPKHLSLSCNSCFKIAVNIHNNITRNGIYSWKVIQASSARDKHLWDGKTPSDQYPHSTWEQSLITSYCLIFKLPWRHVRNLKHNHLVFFFIMTDKSMHEEMLH